ncbi:SIR2 family protein [Bacillus safensis]|uniref:SIR2 family NAD-dependent protein deacylase n=1 Tax=Bacillus safensis TaxID=561879 RepID=UPI000B435C38|nr:SIR2 family protein [Bacillus safensis]MCK8453245.1 SIR2 family protein [Bacillus safensis]MCY7492576.1 SIR2 family protein [Bacillus safensis]MED4992714.1 SIR2 family protein [Bacillus safensis]UDB46799.1 SIR2 family protein [Bacillus safensis]USD79821.1 SIR2 family protein [Bacillus safensis]
MDVNILNLKRDYLEGKVIPFIGAGLSAPFQVPTWKMLIEKITEEYATGKYDFVRESVKILLERNDYWKAIEQLKDFLPITEQDIQTQIVRIINELKITLEDDSRHNYFDIAQMNFKLYLTTNYENILNEYVKCDVPLILKDVDLNTQELFDTKRIFHLHGYLSNPGSIVITKRSYQDLYSNNKYKELLKLVTGTRKLLFIGFSFDDQFLRQLIKDHREYFKGEHYIILDNPSELKVRDLKTEFGLNTIQYNSMKSSHSEEIRRLLSEISESDTEEDIYDNESESKDSNKSSPVVLGAQISEIDQRVESNLFYKKLEIENIDPALRDLSSAFYVAAEVYIRNLKKSGMSLDVINNVLGKVLIKYKEKYYDTYRKYGDSLQFVEVVHETLEKLDLGRLSNLFNENQISDVDENRGLIHILTNDENIDIWWGEKRQ